MTLQRLIIERDVPAVGSREREQLRAAVSKSKDVMRGLGPDIQWAQSYVSDDKTFCVYLAREAIIREHAVRWPAFLLRASCGSAGSSTRRPSGDPNSQQRITIPTRSRPRSSQTDCHENGAKLP
jgi:hypothetical protein